MLKCNHRLEIVFTDFDPLVCAAAERSFAAVLKAHPAARVRVQVVQGNMLAATIGVNAHGYDDYLTNLGYSRDQKDEFLKKGFGSCREPILRWDSNADPMSLASNENATGSSASGFSHSCDDKIGKPYSQPQDTAQTFLVYGANSAGVACGNAQTSISEAFPVQFQEVHAQILREQHADADDDFWPLDTQGRIYAGSSDSGQDSDVCLLAAVVFPRAHDEYGNSRDVFTNALSAAMSSRAYAKGYAHERSVRVVTHALGAFTGHPDPPQFATSMAEGLANYLHSDVQ